jgi:hypothetical protein
MVDAPIIDGNDFISPIEGSQCLFNPVQARFRILGFIEHGDYD